MWRSLTHPPPLEKLIYNNWCWDNSFWSLPLDVNTSRGENVVERTELLGYLFKLLVPQPVSCNYHKHIFVCCLVQSLSLCVVVIAFGFIYGLVMSTKQRWYPCSGPQIDSLIELLEMHFEFPFNLIGKSTITFLTVQSRYTGGDPEQEFQPCFTEGLNQKFSSVCGTGYLSVWVMGMK